MIFYKFNGFGQKWDILVKVVASVSGKEESGGAYVSAVLLLLKSEKISEIFIYWGHLLQHIVTDLNN